MKKISAFVLFIIISMACNSNKNITSSSKNNVDSTLKRNALNVNMILLTNYAMNSSVPLPDPINHRFIATSEELNKTFHMTKASPGTAIVPDFNSQFVVAIILQPTKKVVSIDLQKAEISDKDLNIYYAIIDTTSWITYPHTIKAAAAVPKNTAIKQVNFYKNDVKEKTILVND